MPSFGVTNRTNSDVDGGGTIGKEETILMMQTKDSLIENFGAGNQTNRKRPDIIS